MIISLYYDLIDPFIPYTISVTGATIKGRGEAVLTDVFFTQEGSKLIEDYTARFQFVSFSSSIWSS